MENTERLQPADVPRILIDHESRISTLEESRSDQGKRIDTLERYMRSLQALGWRLFLGVLAAVAAPFVVWLLETTARGGH